jgi:hypothetical protein
MNSTPDYQANNEDKFGFLVFDKKGIDAFLIKYSGLGKMDNKFIEAFKILQNNIAPPVKMDSENEYQKHTKSPESSDSDLAHTVLDIVSNKHDEKYFSHALIYLFFYQCLPKEFQNKWIQDFSGDFEFNANFFELLRKNSKTFVDHLTSAQGYWDKKLSKIFGDFHPNEITAAKAKDIKATILQSKDFDDSRLQIDKQHFLEFLNNVIGGKWRMFLLDQN